MRYIKEDPSAPGSPVRQGDEPNVDHLIPKLNLFFYGDRDNIDNIEKQGGIYTPASLLKKFPDQADEIKKIYGYALKCKIKRNSVMVFMSRVPTAISKTSCYIHCNLPVRISIAKLLKAKQKYKAYLFNHPKNPDKMYELTIDQIDDLTKMEDKWFESFKNSTDPYFRDVPQIAIYCGEDGHVPSFACKVLKGE